VPDTAPAARAAPDDLLRDPETPSGHHSVSARLHVLRPAFARRTAIATARVTRALLRLLPARRRGLHTSRLVNLGARLLWELTMRWAPQGTHLRCRLESGATVELDLSERIQGQAAMTGVYEPMLCEAIARRLPAAGTFFDVGSNVGLVTFEVLGRAASPPRVHAFEPFAGNVAALRRNVDLNPGAEVHVVGSAVGAAVGAAALLPSQVQSESGCHRIVGDSDGGAVAGTVEVPVTTIDDYAAQHGIERVDVMKVDVEGLEAAVLEGAKGMLSRQAVGVVILEVNEELIQDLGGEARQLYDTLLSYGYRPQPIPSTSPSRLVSRLRHLAPEDVAFEAASTPTGP
jgi:FkbM family methyltransferase